MANAQTEASRKWFEKAGYVKRSYSLKRDVTDAFREACAKAGVSQASQLTKMMQEFIEQQKS